MSSWRANDRQAILRDLEAAERLPAATPRRDRNRARHRADQELLGLDRADRSHRRRSVGVGGLAQSEKHLVNNTRACKTGGPV